MRIGIDARMYNEGLGIGRYIAKLIAHLEKLDTSDTFVIFLTKKNWNDYHPQNRRFIKACIDIRWYTLAEQLLLPFLLLRYRLNLVHFPHFNIPLLYPGKYIMTIHDLILIKHPLSATSAASTRHPLVHKIKHLCYRFVLHCSVFRAAHIIAVSQSVKNDIITVLHASDARVSVIYEATDTLPDSEQCVELTKFEGKKFFFRAGNAYPHKNVEGLLSAFRAVHAQHPSFLLLLCGQEDFFQKRIVAAIAKAGLSDVVIHLGSVSDACLAWLYSHAYAYVFPSFEEGFGLPAVEAFRQKCPVLAADIPVLKEICVDAARYFNPKSTDDMIQALHALIEHPSDRESMVEKGLLRSQVFSWDVLAKETQRVYTRYAS